MRDKHVVDPLLYQPSQLLGLADRWDCSSRQNKWHATVYSRHILQLPFHDECPLAMFSVTGVLQLAVT